VVALDHRADLVGEQPAVARLPAQEAQQRFLRDNHVVLDGLWNVELAEVLQTEATAMRAFAGPPSDGPVIRVGGTRTSQRPALMTRPGPVLAELHGSLTRFLRALSARMLVPSQATYTYYELDEEVRLHVDTPPCDVTLITEVLGKLGPLHLHPELEGMPTDDLVQLEGDSNWDRSSGLPVVHPRLGATIFRGRVLPHHRPEWPVEGLHAIAALHYRFML
jgi:hypothetical protein